MAKKMNIAFFGSSILSAYWNGAATYYRGILKALHKQGHSITFFEPDAYDRQKHRDLDSTFYAENVVYPAKVPAVKTCLYRAKDYDIVIKASGVGVFDEMLEEEVLNLKSEGSKVIFMDVDAPATLERVNTFPDDYFRPLIPEYDAVFTYGGGPPVIKAYTVLGAQQCIPIYNALDQETHFPVPADERFRADLAFLGNRMPDREKRVEEFFFKPAKMLRQKKFLLGGNGWEYIPNELPNIKVMGHIYTKDHNAFNCTPLAVLNISRKSMADYGYSPATRVFEAAGAGACIITDNWKGVELFLEPEKECITVESGEDVAEQFEKLTPQKAAEIGQAAKKRVLQQHTYNHRAKQLENIFDLLMENPVENRENNYALK